MSERVWTYVTSELSGGSAELRHDQVVMTCPFCGKDGHFYVHSRRGWFRCFKCGEEGSVGRWIGENPSRWGYLLGLRGSPEPRRDVSRVQENIGGLQLYPLSPRHRGDPLPWLVECRKSKAEEYCLGRGMTRRQIDQYRVSVSSCDGRVYFPYHDERGAISYYMARAMGDQKPKTLEPGSEKPLYGSHVQRYGGWCVLVEGVFDHFVTPWSYSIMGSDVNHGQIATLRATGVGFAFVLMDPDAPDKADRVVDKLRRGGVMACGVDMVDTEKDPADLGREIMRGLIKELEQLVHASIPSLPRRYSVRVGSTPGLF